MDLKFNQNGQLMSLPVVIQFGGIPGSKKNTFNFIFLVLLSLILNVVFCHEDGGGELCNLNINCSILID